MVVTDLHAFGQNKYNVYANQRKNHGQGQRSDLIRRLSGTTLRPNDTAQRYLYARILNYLSHTIVMYFFVGCDSLHIFEE